MDPAGILLINVDLLARTFIIGIVIAAPVGAMAMLCVQRVLAHGWRAGIATGVGIAAADAVYAAVAAFGVTAVAELLISHGAQVMIAGGLVLLWLGLRAMRTPPAPAAGGARDPTRLLPMLGSAVGLTLTNPMTILAFAAIFASAGLVAQPGASGAIVVTVGVAAGSLAWWISLSTGVWAIRHLVSERAMINVNRISGGALAAFGVAAVVTGLTGVR